MLTVKKHSSRRKQYKIAAITLLIASLGTLVFFVVKHIQSGGMGETIYKNKPTVDYVPTSPQATPKIKRHKESTTPSHQRPVDPATRQRPGTKTKTPTPPKRTTTPPAQNPTPSATPTPSTTPTPPPETPIDEPTP